jgi:very-short-patch-repair endonuclease
MTIIPFFKRACPARREARGVYETMLAIELDGYSHQLDEVFEKDLKKEQKMNELGINNLRFQDDEVYFVIENVLRSIKNYIRDFEKTHP